MKFVGRPARALACLTLGAMVPVMAPSAGTAQVELLPDGFAIEQMSAFPVGTGQPTAFAMLPDGRYLTTERETGRIHLAAVGMSTAVAIHTIPDVESAYPTRGLLAIAIDPSWPARPYVYCFYTHSLGAGHLDILTASGDLTDPFSASMALASSYKLIDDVTDITDLHNGSTIRFGPDGMLYLSVGDDGWGCRAQDLTWLQGGILRLDVSSMPGPGPGPPLKAAITPGDNPFSGPDDTARLFWAWGLRNPFRFSIDPANGDIFVGDVGQATWEEVDHVIYATGGGTNFGWPLYEGPVDSGLGHTCGAENELTGPIYAYPHQGLAAVAAATVYRSVPETTVSFPGSYDGSLFVVDFFGGWLRRLEETPVGWDIAPAAAGQPSALNWGEGFAQCADFQFGPDGALYFLRFAAAPGRSKGVYRVVRTADTSVATDPGRPQSLRVFPNPAFAGAGAAFDWEVRRPGVHTLEIFEVSGRVLRTLRKHATPAHGRDVIHWDGRAEDGSPVPAGVYLYRLGDSHGAGTEGKVTMIR